jgi:hypothetical protein
VTEIPVRPRPRLFAWAVFLLSFGLLLSDYMARSVLVPAFPVIRREWGLSDTQLGALTGMVALAVGVLAVPLSFAVRLGGRGRRPADRAAPRPRTPDAVVPTGHASGTVRRG